jgi:hypothetical protein
VAIQEGGSNRRPSCGMTSGHRREQSASLQVTIAAGGVGEWFPRLRAGQVKAAVLKRKIADALIDLKSN